MPGRTTVQLAIWIDADLGTRFRNHCLRHGILLRAATAEAITGYLRKAARDEAHRDSPRAGAAAEPTDGLSLHLSTGDLRTRESDSHDGGHEK
jgi:hypothetical protein